MISVIILLVLAIVLLVLAIVLNKKRRDDVSGWLLAFAIMTAGAFVDELIRWLFL